ncbi:MAG: YihY/virulence factor BrkB family protein [Candidatus Sericytochromatia bacterium]
MKQEHKHLLFKDLLSIDTLNYQNKFVRFLIRELQVINLSIKLFLKNQCLIRSTDLAFTSMFALVPLLSVVFMILKLYGIKEIINTKLKPYIYGFLTPVSSKQISEYLDSFLNSATVETLGTLGILFLFISVFLTLGRIEENFNYIWKIKRNRNLKEKVKSYWTILSISPILIIFYTTLSSYFDNLISEYSFFEYLIQFIAFDFLPFLIVSLFFAIMIVVMPNCKVEADDALAGSFYATGMYYLTKNIFVDYSKLAVSYDVIYGSLAVLPFFMLWIYWFWNITLFSVQITYTRQNFQVLKNSYLSQEISFDDKLRAAFLIIDRMLKDYINSSKALRIVDYSKELKIPVNHLEEIFEDLKKSHLIKLVDYSDDIYIPNIPISEISADKIFKAINKKYSKEFEIKLSKAQLENILSEQSNLWNKYKNTKIEDLL